MRPRRTMTAVEKALRTSFWAVPALSRVDPVMTSGPVSTASRWSAANVSSACGLAVTSSGDRAPLTRAGASAPATYGVRPDAVSPTSDVAGPTGRASSARPASTSSSTFSTARSRAAGPPAWWATNRPSGALKVGQQLGGVEDGEAAGGAGTEVVDAAAALQRSTVASTAVASCGQHLGYRRGDLGVLAVEQSAASPGWTGRRFPWCRGGAPRWARSRPSGAEQSLLTRTRLVSYALQTSMM